MIKNAVLSWKSVKVIIVCTDGGHGLPRAKCVIICSCIPPNKTLALNFSSIISFYCILFIFLIDFLKVILSACVPSLMLKLCISSN